MFRSVLAVTGQNADQPHYQALPILKTVADEFRAKVQGIVDYAAKHNIPTNLAEEKLMRRREMVRIGFSVASALKIFASRANNPDLKSRVAFSRTAFDDLGETEIDDRCQLVHDEAASRVAELKDYNITAPTLAELQAAINTYNQTIDAPRVKIAGNKAVTQGLLLAFDAAEQVLTEQLDPGVDSLEDTHPDFVRTYRAARIIVDRGAGRSPNPEPAPPPAG